MMMMASAQEITCETTASHVRFLERRNAVGRDASLLALAQGALVRAAGFRGDLSDALGIYAALLEHFGAERAAKGFHFVRDKARASGSMLSDVTSKSDCS